MATSINTNLASLFAQNSLSNAQNNLASSVQRLSSGLRINSAKDDAAGLSIAQNMQSQINGTNQSIRNLSDATNLLQVADSSLSTVQDMLLRLKQLSVQGFDGSLSASQKLNIVQEMKDLNSEINATAQRTQFNGINLLTSGASLDTVNSDVKNGVTLINSAAQVSTTSGLGAGSTLNDAGNTIYSLSLTDSKAQYAPGSYTLQASGNNLTMTGTFQGKVQSQTVALADLVGYAPSTSGLNRPVITNVNFSNFGIEMRLTSSIAAGTTETGATLAAAITTKSNSIVVDGKGGQISNVKLSGVNPGTYQMTFGNTGSVSAFGMPAGLVSGQTSAGVASNVALVGGNGSGATANISYDAQGKISSIAVQGAGTGYKAGDVLSTAAITAGTVNAVTISTVQGAGAATESARVTFAALAAGEVMSLGGLTYTAGSSGATAAQVANAFSNLVNGATTGVGTQFVNGSGSYTGNFNGWTAGAASGNSVQFTSTQANTPITDLTAAAASVSPVILTTEGAANVTETASVRFSALAATKSVVLGGLTFTAGSADLSAEQVAYAFMGLANTNTAANANASTTRGAALSGTTGTFTTGTLTGWSTTGQLRSTGVAANDTLVFTSSTASSQVTDLAPVGSPTFVTTAGGADGVTEQAAVTFNAAGLAAGETMNLGGLMFTAGTTALTTTQVATAFANLSNGATTGSGSTYGTYSGQFNGYSTGAVTGTSSNIVTFRAASANTNIATDLAAGAAGTAPTFVVTAGTASSTESTTANFTAALTSGQTLTLGGLTFTSGAAGTTVQQLAAAFSNLSSGVTGASLNASGQSTFGSFSGTFTGWNTAIVGANSTLVTFTSTTPNLDVTNLSAAISGAAPSIATVQGRTAGTESTVATFSALAAGQTLSLGGLSYTATVAHTAAEVAQAFAGLAAGAAPTQAVETATATFSDMAASASVTVGGLRLTNGTGATIAAALVAEAFASGGTTLNGLTLTSGSLTGFTGANIGSGVAKFRATSFGQVTDLARTIDVGAATVAIVTVGGDVGSGTGTYTGALSGWHSAAATNNASTLTFTSNTLASDVSDLSLTASVPNAPVVSTINQGSAAATESALVTFSAMTAGQTLTLAGLTFTAGVGGSTAAEVASYFSTSGGLGIAGASVGTGTMTGTRAGWTSGSAAVGSTLVFTSSTTSVNVANLAAPTSGTAPVIVTTQQGGSTSSTETSLVTFDAAAMTSGDTVTVGGLTFTAGANGATRAQVAAAFSGLSAGTSSANLSSANGTFSGTLTGWSTGASNGTGVSFTSATASAGVDDLTSSVSRRQALNALSGIVVGGLANQTGGNVLTMSGLVNGNLQTQGITLKDNAANTSQTLNFDKFGVQFDVDSFQSQTSGEIGAVLASLNSSSANYGTTGAFVPGQVVVSQGSNSALKFQSGADSSSFIQIDTLNIQTGSSGIEAGSDKQMMDVGSVIADSGVGKLGALGLNDSIDTWQTAFKNAAAAVDTAIEYVSSKRATYGSQMNRLSFVTTNLTAQSTNLQNSRSAIIDTDFASETAKLTKGQIMQQAATAMLAQANQMPNVILSLLK